MARQSNTEHALEEHGYVEADAGRREAFRRQIRAAVESGGLYSLCKHLSRNMGSCSIISIEIFIVGILSW